MQAGTLLRLAIYFRMSDEFWTGMQPLYERNVLKNDKAFQAATGSIVPRPDPAVRNDAA